MKTTQIKLGAQTVTLTHGIDELLALSKLTGRDMLKGEHWLQGINSDNFLEAILILVRRAHPSTFTVEGLRASLPAEVMVDFLKACTAEGFLLEKDPLALSASDGAPFAESTSASPSKKSKHSSQTRSSPS